MFSNMPMFFEENLKRYDTDESRYHNRNHIRECLQIADTLLGTKGEVVSERDYHAIRCALLFHDMSYDPAIAMLYKNQFFNEKVSGALWNHAALKEDEFVLAGRFIEDVWYMIIETGRHSSPYHSADLAYNYVRDIDLLAGLGWGSFDKFVEISKKIRNEHNFLSDIEFASGRLQFLYSLVGRRKLFGVSALEEAYGNNARNMLIRYINSMLEDARRDL